jgi:hypothetical protein
MDAQFGRGILGRVVKDKDRDGTYPTNAMAPKPGADICERIAFCPTCLLEFDEPIEYRIAADVPSLVAIARHAKLSYCRQCENLREHVLIASLRATQVNAHHIIALRNRGSAGDSMVAAIVLVRRLERKVEILAEPAAHHRMGQQCPHQQQTLKTYRLAIP